MELPIHQFQSLVHAYVAYKGHIIELLQDLLSQRLRNDDLLLAPNTLAIRPDGVK